MIKFQFKKFIYLFCTPVIYSFPSVFSQEVVPLHNDYLLIENFTGANSYNGLPLGWRSSRNDCSMFKVLSEKDDCFVRLIAKNKCTSFGKTVDFSTDSLPFLVWKWRVFTLPEGGCENKRESNDSGAGVYVIFKGKFKLNKVIKYVWSTTLPVGTTLDSPYNSNTKIVVLQSGKDNMEKWIKQKVNIRNDFIRLFKFEPPPVVGVAILSDSDNTSSCAVADYDDFQALKTDNSQMSDCIQN
jgi:hypothetical protein